MEKKRRSKKEKYFIEYHMHNIKYKFMKKSFVQNEMFNVP